jgi:hypothetical protein
MEWASATKIVQGWPKLWANFRALIGIFSQSVGPSVTIWANPVQFSLNDLQVHKTITNTNPAPIRGYDWTVAQVRQRCNPRLCARSTVR